MIILWKTSLGAENAERVDESRFLETNWRHGTKLGQFWDSEFLAISRAEMPQKLIDIVALIDLYKIRSLVGRK